MFDAVAAKPLILQKEGEQPLTLLLSPLAPEGLSLIVDYCKQHKQPESEVTRTLRLLKDADLNQVTAEDRREMLLHAQELDHEERMRDRFVEMTLPPGVFFDADVLALLLHLTGQPKQPDLSLDRAKEIVQHYTPLAIIAHIGMLFPADTEKKDPALSASLNGGRAAAGRTRQKRSSKRRTTR